MDTLRVLVADDDQSMLRNMKRLFEAGGFVVDTATSYVTMREFLDTREYALIICDNQMPLGGESRPHRTCGLQLLAHAKMRDITKKTPFVLHTSDEDEETKRLVEQFDGIYRHKLDTSITLLDFCADILKRRAAN